MHIVERLDLPPGYTARPYRGRDDHEAIAEILTAYRLYRGEQELVTAAQIDSGYANLADCDPETDIYVVEHDGREVAYGRTMLHEVPDGRQGYVFTPTRPEHLTAALFHPLVDGIEDHLLPSLAGRSPARFRSDAAHPGPGQAAVGQAAWLEARGYEPREWGAHLVRPHLDEIPERTLPPGVELRPVTEEQRRTIVAAHFECFRGEWDFIEPTEADFSWYLDDPIQDHTLWKVAWAGDQVVGQVKPYINHEENEARGYRRGYTEHISTHHDWRNQGIAGTLLAWSLQELEDRGMTEASLGVDTNNPGGAFQLYQSLGFELDSYGAVYFRDLS